MPPDAWEWLLRHLPWYSPAAQARRQARTERAHHNAQLVIHVSIEKVLNDYTAAEAARRKP